MEATLQDNKSDTPQVVEQAIEGENNEGAYEPPKRAPGRPPKNPNKVAVTLPKPPAFQIKKPQVFVEYWKSLSKSQAQTCIARVYRLWPVVNNKQLNPESNNDIDTIVGEECFFSAPDEWEDSLLHRYGSGWYQLYLNQEKSCICRVVMKTRQDLVNHPPKLVSGTLVEGHPDNAGYMQYLRDRGLYKDERIEAESMQASETINKLTDKVIDMANRASIPIPQNNNNNDRVISELVRPMMSMMEKANESAIETVKAQTSGNDPIATMTAMGGILKELKGDSGSRDDGVKVMLEATMKQNSMLLEKLFTKEPAQPVKSGVEQMKELFELMDMAKKASGIDKDKDEEENPNKRESIGETLLRSLPSLAPLALQFIDRGIMMFNLLRASPQQLANQQVQQQQQAFDPLQAQRAAQAQAAQLQPQPQPQVQTQPQTQLTPEQVMEQQQKQQEAQQYIQYHGFLATLAPAIISTIYDTEKDGFDFADDFIKSYGRIMYGQLKGVGQETLIGAIKSYAPLMSQLSGVTPERLESFVHEFMTVDELPQDDEGDEGDEDGKGGN